MRCVLVSLGLAVGAWLCACPLARADGSQTRLRPDDPWVVHWMRAAEPNRAPPWSADIDIAFVRVDTGPNTARECKPRYMVGPGMGVVVAPGVVLGGSVAVTVGTWDFSGSYSRTALDRGIIALGAIGIAGGVALLIGSAHNIGKKRARRNEVCGPLPDRLSGFLPEDAE